MSLRKETLKLAAQALTKVSRRKQQLLKDLMFYYYFKTFKVMITVDS